MAGKTPFVIYQGAWSILQRDFEREIIPMARAEGESSSRDLASQNCSAEADGRGIMQVLLWLRGACLRQARFGRTPKRSVAGKQGRRVRAMRGVA